MSSKTCGDERSIEPFAFKALAKACAAEPAERGIKPAPTVPFRDGDRTNAHAHCGCSYEQEDKNEPAEKAGQTDCPSLRGARVGGTIDAQRRCLIVWHQGKSLERVFIEPSGLAKPGAALPSLERRDQRAAWHAIDRALIVTEQFQILLRLPNDGDLRLRPYGDEGTTSENRRKINIAGGAELGLLSARDLGTATPNRRSVCEFSSPVTFKRWAI